MTKLLRDYSQLFELDPVETLVQAEDTYHTVKSIWSLACKQIPSPIAVIQSPDDHSSVPILVLQVIRNAELRNKASKLTGSEATAFMDRLQKVNITDPCLII